MNDPIKEFVEQNRAAFDELEAPAFNLEGFKKRVNPEPEEKIKKLWPAAKWLVAASVLIALGTTFLIFRENSKPAFKENFVQKVKTEQENRLQDKPVTAENKIFKPKTNKYLANVITKKAVKKEFKEYKVDTFDDEVYAKLVDSSSSSTRLSAILDIDKSGQINNDVLDRLAKTLNSDENSNVRLAALSVLEKYSFDKYASTLLVSALNTQNDPMVQLGLVNILGKMKNLNINDKLYALANDPNTFGAVKDEAYSILLKEDKL